MNKKFLSAILFGALMVTSTGTFVSCKDYDDDIKDLQEQIDAQKSGLTAQITALQAALSTAQSDATAAKAAAEAAKQAAAEAKATAIAEALKAIEEAKDATDDELAEIAAAIAAIDSQLLKLEGDYDKQDAALNTLKIQVEALENYKALVAEKADVDAIEKTIAEIKEAMKSIATSDSVAALDKKVEELAAKVAELSEDLVTIEAKSLRALVFVPSLYVDGVESFRYPYAPGYYLSAGKTATEGKIDSYLDQPEVDFTIPATSKWEYAASTSAYTLTPIQTLNYHLNPSHVSIDDIAFELTSNDAEFVSTRAAETKTWTAKFVKAAKNGCELEVDYKIEAPEYIKWAGKHGKNSIVSLHATLEEGKTISSDYASILPAVQTLKAIAFKDKTTPAVDCVLGDELYLTGKDAAKKAPSIAVAYNKGGINLDDLLNIHYTQKDFEAPDASAEHKIMDYKVAKENYGLKFEYEMMPYFVGKNATNESMYGKVVDNMFYPCYVKTGATPTQVVCGTNNEGISAVGKMPIVQVRLVDAAGNVVLNGYIKLHIVKEIGYTDFVVKSFELPLICGRQDAKITWDEASDLIYEKLGKSKEEFHNEFTVESTNYWYPYLKTTDAAGKVTFVKTTINDGWGEVLYSQDGIGSGSTNAWVYYTTNWYEITALKKIAKLANREQTFYLRFVSKTDETYSVYVGLTIKVAQAPEATFGEKIAAYWYADITGTAQENVRNNVLRPTTAGIASKDVLNYEKDLNDNFIGNKIKVSLTSAAQNKLYVDGTYSYRKDYEFTTKHKYQFAATQPKVGDYQLARGTVNFNELYAGKVKVAEITTTGVVTYLNNETSQAILNLFGHSETSAAKMQYANVEVVAVYDYCEEPLANTTFPVRFLRPVDILEGPNAAFEDAQANGSAVVLGDFIKLQDWRDMNLLAYNTTAKAYESAVENGCPLFDYYLFENIKIDIDNASSTLTGKKELLKNVTDKLKLSVIDGSSETFATTTVDFSAVGALNTTKIVYYNNAGNVQEFNLYIPVEITYSWGTLKGEIVAKVAKTKAN